jgi:chitin disaccharide deacetylase
MGVPTGITTRRALLAAAAAGVAASALAEEKTLVERLGYSKSDRLLILHADDVGMCHSVNTASTRALTEGVASSASVMVPCPWFPEVAAWSKEHPEADLGLHLTLTSEWRHYRWRPVTPIDKVPGLVDDEGFMWRSVEQVKAHAKAEEVEREIRAQIERARQFGMKPTHVDSHMGTLFADQGYFEAYVRVAKETGIMPMLPGPTAETLAEAKELGIDYPPLVRKLQSQGFLFLDRLTTGLTGDTYEARQAAFAEFVKGLKPGVTELIVHLAGDDEEIRHVTGNWRNRFNEFRLCTDSATRTLLQREGIRLLSYRELGKLWRP